MRVTAGNTIEFSVSSPTYTQDDGYSGLCSFVNSAAVYTAETMTYTDSGFDFTISAADSAEYDAGGYRLTVFAVNDTERHQIYATQIEVLPDPMTAVDSRTTIRKIYDALEAAILSQATDGQLSLSIAGTTIGKMGLSELIEARDKYKFLLQQEEAAERLENGERPRNRMFVRYINRAGEVI